MALFSPPPKASRHQRRGTKNALALGLISLRLCASAGSLLPPADPPNPRSTADQPQGYWRQYSYIAIAAAVATLWLYGEP
jgi:hypothetical protein